MGEVRVEVTGELVQYALARTNSRCAIALALKNASEDFILPYVDQNRISVTDVRRGVRYTFTTPETIAKWIDAFDRQTGQVKPFRFGLNMEDADVIRPIKHQTVKEAIDQTQRDKARRAKTYQPQASVSRSERVLR